jgi:hypothetical protein
MRRIGNDGTLTNNFDLQEYYFDYIIHIYKHDSHNLDRFFFLLLFDLKINLFYINNIYYVHIYTLFSNILGFLSFFINFQLLASLTASISHLEIFITVSFTTVHDRFHV